MALAALASALPALLGGSAKTKVTQNSSNLSTTSLNVVLSSIFGKNGEADLGGNSTSSSQGTSQINDDYPLSNRGTIDQFQTFSSAPFSGASNQQKVSNSGGLSPEVTKSLGVLGAVFATGFVIRFAIKLMRKK